MDRYAVLGNPIAHSKSPRIHALFARQTSEELKYGAVLAPTDRFGDTVKKLILRGYKGMNVTVPFKQDAWSLSDECSPAAQRARAVNTIEVRPDGTLAGHNTDGAGLLRDLTVNHDIELRGQRVLLLGAGGGVRGVLAPLLLASPASIVIANRTESRALELAREFSDAGAIQACGYDGLAGSTFDLIINGTAAGLEGELPPLPDDVLTAGGNCYSMLYGDQARAFCDWAQAHGAAHALDGLGMLVEQAAESFAIWRGVRPRTQPVMDALRKNN